jgi:ElaB/YqjD/DUF883 family membrane-anchored ribosome-binding protein
MDQEPDLSAQRPEEIRHHIDETRCDLTDKLEALEQKVMDTVADAKSAVVDTVETVTQSVDSTVQAVKDTVHATVDSVKDALDLGRQVQRHPWAMLAGSLTAGYVLGRLVSQRQPVSPAVTRNAVEALPPQLEAGRRLLDFHPAGIVSPLLPGPVAEPRAPERSLFREFTEKFAPEIQKLKGLVIGTLMAQARDAIKQSVAPPLSPELERVIDCVTTKLGGVPLSGPVLNLYPRKDSHNQQDRQSEAFDSHEAVAPARPAGHKKQPAGCQAMGDLGR